MSIRAYKRGWMVTVYKDNRRHRRCFKQHGEAEAWELESRARLARGKLPHMGIIAARCNPIEAGLELLQTMQGLFDHVKETRWAGKKSELEVVRSTAVVVKLVGATKHPSVVTAATYEVLTRRFRLGTHRKPNKREKKVTGVSNGTINRHLQALGTLMNTAVRLGVNPK